MTIKTLTAALVLTLMPALSLAQGCSHGKEASMSCGEGSVYDAATGTCTTINS